MLTKQDKERGSESEKGKDKGIDTRLSPKERDPKKEGWKQKQKKRMGSQPKPEKEAWPT